MVAVVKGSSFEHEIERGDDLFVLEVTITNEGYEPITHGPPDNWDPGEGPSWKVGEVHLYDHDRDDLGRVVACPELTEAEERAIDERATVYVREQ